MQISFDDECKIRILDAEKFKKTEELEEECKQFISKIKEFNGTVHSIVELMDGQSTRIEAEKKKAIGKRIQVEGEAEHRARQQAALQALINEKKAELDRYTAQYNSLLRVEQEQTQTIERLSNNET